MSFKMYIENEITIIEHLIYPKFKASIVDDKIVDEVEIDEDEFNAEHLDKAFKNAEEFIKLSKSFDA